HLELGEMTALEHDIAELGRIGTEFRWLPGRLYRAQWLATRALLEGRFDDVRDHADEMGELARAYHAASGMLALQSFFLGRERGELTGVAALRRVADRHTDTIYLRALVASSYLTAGDVGAATEILDDIASRSFLREKPESGRPAGLALLAEVASIGGSAHAETLYELLEPFGGRLVVALAGLSTLGAADRYLGMLAAAQERWDAAHDHFERALELETSVGGRALLPRTRYWQARALIDRDAPGDAARAQDLIALVMGEARDLGMAGVLADAEKLA